MKTLKIKYKQLTENNKLLLNLYRQQQSIIVRSTFNLYLTNYKLKQKLQKNKSLTQQQKKEIQQKTLKDLNENVVYQKIKDYKNINKLSRYLVTCGIKRGHQLFNSNKSLQEIIVADTNQKIQQLKHTQKKGKYKVYKEIKLSRLKNKLKRIQQNKVIFGSRQLFIKRYKNQISKSQWKSAKLLGLSIFGQEHYKGNRHVEIFNNYINLKLSKNEHIKIQFQQLKPNYKKEIQKILKLAQQKKIALTYYVDNEFINISYQQIKQNNYQKIQNRILGIDLNPNYIGISICDFNKALDQVNKICLKKIYNLYQLNQQNNSNKKDYELLHIVKQIISLAKQYKVQKIVIQKLNITTKNYNKGTEYNKLLNNDWNRNLVVNNLKKRCKQQNIQLNEVLAFYSSFIGNVKYANKSCPDMVAASIELARRGLWTTKGLKCDFTQKNHLLPKFDRSLLNQWKEEINNQTVNDWKQSYQKLGNVVRVLVKDCNLTSFSFKCKQSLVNVYNC